jgi:hypothetical protein
VTEKDHAERDTDDEARSMERFEEFGRKIFRVTKDDLKKSGGGRRKGRGRSDWAGPPVGGPAIAEDED